MPRLRSRLFHPALLLFSLAGLAYWNGLGGPFVFDDHWSILESPNARTLWPLSEAAGAPAGSGASGRPLVALSLALNYALGGLNPTGYRIVNVLVHGLAGVLLWDVVRRARGKGSASYGAALATAALWIVHPLHTDAIQHVVYRNETFAAAAILGTLALADRALRTEARARLWIGATWLACGAAMASKEIAAATPWIVLAWDRTFVSGSFRRAWRQNRSLHLALASTWIVLATCLWAGDRGASVGTGATVDLSVLEYARTQATALLHYLRLAIVPWPLVFDYDDWPIPSWIEAAPALVAVCGLIGLVLVRFRQGRADGFAALAALLVLAPSSSFVPLSGELVAEHRMVLPLAALIAIGVTAGESAFRRLALKSTGWRTVSVVVVLATWTCLTWTRNRDYRSEVVLWEDTVAKRPENARAWNNLVRPYLEQEDLEKARHAVERSLELDPERPGALGNLGVILALSDELAGAERAFQKSIRFDPTRARTRLNFGLFLARLGRTEEAVAELFVGLEAKPWSSDLRTELGLNLLALGRAAQALPLLESAGTSVRAQRGLAWVLATSRRDELRDGARAANLAGRLLQAERSPKHLDLLAAALAELGRFEEAHTLADEAAQAAEARGRPAFARALATRARKYATREPHRE